ncbi:MAG TPA: Fe-S cluster assembly protein SufD, partial [Fusobacteria bacterium]|nr:Fe-S cluster assembly protein SufD [Fusobacteriota bacterium]
LNDDVKCSHGATIGSINEEQLFYLMSRGVTRNEAKLMLINGFLNDLLDKNNREEVLACFKR